MVHAAADYKIYARHEVGSEAKLMARVERNKDDECPLDLVADHSYSNCTSTCTYFLMRQTIKEVKVANILRSSRVFASERTP